MGERKVSINNLLVLRSWLQDNIDCDSELMFAEGIDSNSMIKVIDKVIKIADIPEAKTKGGNWREYYYVRDQPDYELSRVEAMHWNESLRKAKKLLS